MPPPLVVYASTDASAPVLNGSAGEFVNLLDKCLVTGYGSKPAAGWTKPYAGTNKAVFRQGGACQFFLRAADHQLTGSTRYTFLRGFEVATDVDTGTGLFPTTAQFTNGLNLLYNTNAVARPWVVIADDRTAYVFTDPSGVASYYGMMFGDFYSYVPGDAYRCGLFAMTDLGADRLGSAFVNVVTTTLGHYVARKYDGTGGALLVGKHGDNYLSNAGLRGVMPYPDPVSGGLCLSPIYIHESAEPLNRGRMRGFWHWVHPTAGIGDRDTFAGAEGTEFEGMTFLIIGLSAAGGLYVMETSNTWVTN